MNQLIKDFEKTFLRKGRPAFKIGDTIKVHLRIVVVEEAEENGNGNGKKKKTAKKETKERIQVFTGTVISKKGSGLSETFTLYRNAYGSSMEKVFLLNSPKISKIEIVRSGRVRRAKLTYIRGRTGKAAKIRERMGLFHHETPEIEDRIPAQEEPVIKSPLKEPEVKNSSLEKPLVGKPKAKKTSAIRNKKPSAKKPPKEEPPKE